MFNYFPLGLDISDYKLRIVQLYKSLSESHLVSFNEISVPAGYIQNGIIKDSPKVASLLKELRQKAKGRRIFQKKVIVALPEKQSFLKIIKPVDLSEPAIISAASKELPFDWKEIYWDWIKLSSDVADNSILIGACKKVIVDNYIKTLQLAGLQPMVLEIEALAISRALCQRKNSLKQPILIIDLGYARTTLIIIYQCQVQFTTSFNSVIENDHINLEQLEQDIERIINFYQDHLKLTGLPELSKVLLCGSGSYSLETIQILNKFLKLPVAQGNTWLNLHNQVNKNISNSLAYTTAIGLALRPALNHSYI